MLLFDGLLDLLDSRSFSTIWFWVILASVWTFEGRNVLGVPPDVIRRAARRDRTIADTTTPDDDPGALALLDWLSLILPRWQVSRQEGPWLMGLGAFALSLLMILGFGYGLEMAQALFLLLAPLALVLLIKLRLAASLRQLLAQAQAGQNAPNKAALLAARRMRRHRMAVTAISILVVSATAFWGTLWMLTHPFGL